MLIRKMKIWDLNKIPKLLRNNLQIGSLDLTFTLIHFIFNIPLRLLGLSTFFGSIAQIDGKNIGGLFIVRRFPNAKIWVIGPIVVDRKYRSRGIGTDLLNFTLKILIEKKADGVLISINDDVRHLAARKLFRRFGFKVIIKVFTTPKQTYKYSRMISRGQNVSKLLQENLLKTAEPKDQTKYLYYIFCKIFS